MREPYFLKTPKFPSPKWYLPARCRSSDPLPPNPNRNPSVGGGGLRALTDVEDLSSLTAENTSHVVIPIFLDS